MLKTKKTLDILDILLKLFSLFIISIILWYTPIFTVTYEYNDSNEFIDTDYYQIEYDYNFYGYMIANKTTNKNYYSIDSSIISRESIWSNWVGSIIFIFYSFLPLLLLVNIWKYPNLKFKELLFLIVSLIGVLSMITTIYTYFTNFQAILDVLESYYFSEYSINYGDKLYLKFSEVFLIIPISITLIITISSIAYDKFLTKNLLLIPKNKVLKKFLNEIINKEENNFWDFKQSLEMWHIDRKDKMLRFSKQVEFCEHFAAFANSNGGLIIIGISDKIPRKFYPIDGIENKKQYIGKALIKWLDPQVPRYILKEVEIKMDSEAKKCLVLVIPQTKRPVGVKQPDTISFRYPLRIETGKDYLSYKVISDKKFGINSNNTDFFKDLNKIIK